MDVTTVVTGHYLIYDDQLDITLEADDLANNRSVWRDNIRVVASDKIAMREQINSRVRQGLVPVLGGLSSSSEAGTRPKSEEAYDLYLRSIALPHDVAPNQEAIAMLERAVGIDPSYAPVWDALGLRYYYSGAYGDGGEPMLKRSDSATERALALDPNLISAAAWLIARQTDRGDTAHAYAQAAALFGATGDGSLKRRARATRRWRWIAATTGFGPARGLLCNWVRHSRQWILFASTPGRNMPPCRPAQFFWARANWPRRAKPSREPRSLR
jgi:tetratricopeptide (TPR) repeat protein